MSSGDEAAPQGQREWPFREGACEVLGRSPLCLGKHSHIVITPPCKLFDTVLVRTGSTQHALLVRSFCACSVRVALRVFFVCTESFLHAIVFVFNPSVVSETFPLAHSVRASCMKHEAQPFEFAHGRNICWRFSSTPSFSLLCSRICNLVLDC